MTVLKGPYDSNKVLVHYGLESVNKGPVYEPTAPQLTLSGVNVYVQLSWVHQRRRECPVVPSSQSPALGILAERLSE